MTALGGERIRSFYIHTYNVPLGTAPDTYGPFPFVGDTPSIDMTYLGLRAGEGGHQVLQWADEWPNDFGWEDPDDGNARYDGWRMTRTVWTDQPGRPRSGHDEPINDKYYTDWYTTYSIDVPMDLDRNWHRVATPRTVADRW